MLSTGDVNGCLRKLETLLRSIKYPGYVDYNGLSKGDPSAFLPIVSFTLTSFSPPFAKQLMEAGLELTGKTDLRFTDTLYKVLRDVFHYKPILTKQQFLQWGFSLRKVSVTCDIINFVLQKHNQKKKVSERPSDVNHVENSSIFPKNSTDASSSDNVTSHKEVCSSSSPGNGIREVAGWEEEKDNIPYTSEMEVRLSALESQQQSLLSGLNRLSILEKRLEELDKQRNKDKNEGDVITISRESWENLMSRVLLLETKLDLNTVQLSDPPQCPSSVFSCSSSSMPDASKEDLKNRLERITNMLKSTSSLLKNNKSSTTNCK
ncbi:centrosomal protein of 44 kDa isoform X2 [Centropristis striata]|uniref:centrosomal protein of 44 kDa isoform X2 n=1 Tax=Centropristis striata TaxID=184440 RepID=UPI0027E0CB2D|nr:centrosomal protein of 44 kDa isoform X2 [Centropristis striata]